MRGRWFDHICILKSVPLSSHSFSGEMGENLLVHWSSQWFLSVRRNSDVWALDNPSFPNHIRKRPSHFVIVPSYLVTSWYSIDFDGWLFSRHRETMNKPSLWAQRGAQFPINTISTYNLKKLILLQEITTVKILNWNRVSCLNGLNVYRRSKNLLLVKRV
jgi:hypothetical protein